MVMLMQIKLFFFIFGIVTVFLSTATIAYLANQNLFDIVEEEKIKGNSNVLIKTLPPIKLVSWFAFRKFKYLHTIKGSVIAFILSILLMYLMT